MTTRRLLPIALICLVSALNGTNAQGAIVVSFGPSNPGPLVAGSSGLLDVFVRTDAGSVRLDFFQVELSLSGPANGLLFADPQSDAQLTKSNYAFFNVSSAQINFLPVGAVTGAGSIYRGSDATDNGAGLSSPIELTTANKLLYQLDLNAVTAGIYSISLNTGNTSFLDESLTPIDIGPSTPGSITVKSVPEPSSLAFLASLAGLSAYRLRRRLRETIGQLAQP